MVNLINSSHSTVVGNFHLNLQLYLYMYYNFILLYNFECLSVESFICNSQVTI